jgi:hypothetical protein
MTYMFDLHIQSVTGEDIAKQNFLTKFPSRWGLCSSNVGLFGLKGDFSFSEKIGFQGTSFFQEGVPTDDPAKALIRFPVFRGGVNDHESWDVGKSGDGIWTNMPAHLNGLLVPTFRWTIRMIDGRDTPLPKR